MKKPSFALLLTLALSNSALAEPYVPGQNQVLRRSGTNQADRKPRTMVLTLDRESNFVLKYEGEKEVVVGVAETVLTANNVPNYPFALPVSFILKANINVFRVPAG